MERWKDDTQLTFWDCCCVHLSETFLPRQVNVPNACEMYWQKKRTSSRPITEVKQHWARIVLGWETAWELQVLLAFFQSQMSSIMHVFSLF